MPCLKRNCAWQNIGDIVLVSMFLQTQNTTFHFSGKTIAKIPNKTMHIDEVTCTSKRIDGGVSRLVPTAVIPWTTASSVQHGV